MTQRQYREDTKRVVITMVACALFLCSTVAMLIHQAYADGTLYAKEGRVVEIDQKARLTTFVDAEGEVWRFKGIKDWDVNDTIVLTMSTQKTENIYDDTIVGVRAVAN